MPGCGCFVRVPRLQCSESTFGGGTDGAGIRDKAARRPTRRAGAFRRPPSGERRGGAAGGRPPPAEARPVDGLWQTRERHEFVEPRSGDGPKAGWTIRTKTALAPAGRRTGPRMRVIPPAPRRAGRTHGGYEAGSYGGAGLASRESNAPGPKGNDHAERPSTRPAARGREPHRDPGSGRVLGPPGQATRPRMVRRVRPPLPGRHRRTAGQRTRHQRRRARGRTLPAHPVPPRRHPALRGRRRAPAPAPAAAPAVRRRRPPRRRPRQRERPWTAPGRRARPSLGKPPRRRRQGGLVRAGPRHTGRRRRDGGGRTPSGPAPVTGPGAARPHRATS